MGRFSPTVVAQPSTGIADGLLAAANNFMAARERRRQRAREDAADARTATDFAEQLKHYGMQDQLDALNLTAARQKAELAPIEADAQARNLGYERGPGTSAITMPEPQAAPLDGSPMQPSGRTVTLNGVPGRYQFNPALAPFTPREEFANILQEQALKDQQATALEAARQHAEDARNAASNDARVKAAQIAADARQYPYGPLTGPGGAAGAGPGVALNQGVALGQLMHMSPAARKAHFAQVAKTALESAEQELPAGDTVSLHGQTLPRDAARKQLAAQKIVMDPSTSQYFSYGMNTDDLNAADQQFAERPAARVSARTAEQQAATKLLGEDSTATAPSGPAAGQSPNAPAKPDVATRDAQLKAQGLKAGARRAQLQKEGYNVR